MTFPLYSFHELIGKYEFPHLVSLSVAKLPLDDVTAGLKRPSISIHGLSAEYAGYVIVAIFNGSEIPFLVISVNMFPQMYVGAVI